MRLLRTRVISFILVLCLCISMWSPVGATVVVAEGNATTDSSGTDTGNTDSGDSTDTGNTGDSGTTGDSSGTGDSGTTGDSSETEASEEYAIVLLDENDKEVTSLGSLNANATLGVFPKVKIISKTSEDSEITDNVESVYLANATFTYESSDEKVATVSMENDKLCITAKEVSTEQSANITVSWVSEEDEKVTATATYEVVVKAVEVSEVTLSRTTKEIVLNKTYDLSSDVQVLPETALQDVVYSSGNESIATVDEAGVVTAKGLGSTTITVESKADSTKKATIVIKIIDAPVSLELNKTAHSMKATDTFQLEAVLVYESGTKKVVDPSLLTYWSGDETVVTIDKNGVVTGLIQETYPVVAVVQASYDVEYTVDGVVEKDIISASCQITITKIPVEGVVIENEVESVTLKINEQYTLKSHVLPTNATNQTVSYKSSDKDVAKVSSSGVITATGIGEATITAYSKEDSSVKDTFIVNVFQTTFNVAELGVDGTDKSNDATELNKILWYATKIDEPITVVIPDGTYYIGKTLKVYTQTNLVLSDNAVIKRMQSAGDKHMLINRTDEDTNGYDQCSDIVITGGTWDGNATGENSANCMYFGHAKNVTITDTTIKNNSGAHLIELAGVKNVLVENVELYGYTMCKEKGYTAAQADKEAIQIDYCSSVSAPAMKPYDGTACDTVTIRNCNIHDYMAGVGTHTEGGKASTNVRVENNTFTNITNACVNLRNFENVNILNNTAKNCTTFVYASNSQGTIKNNKANIGTSYKPKTSSGLRAKNGITISNGSSFTIEKNTFEKAKSNGICIWNGSTAIIKNNKLKNNKLYGIRTQGSTITLKKNSFSKNKKGVYDTYKDAKIKSSDDIRAYYIDIKKSYKYKGKAVKPKIKIKNLNKKYYKVSYKNNKKPGTATVIIKGKGKVKQTLKIKYKIKK